MWSKISAFRRLSHPDQMLLLEAIGALFRAQLSLKLYPFSKIAASLGEIGGESPALAPPLYEQNAREVGWAVETMARHLPWDCRCLAQALAAWGMLQKRGIVTTVYFGVASNPDKPFDAHAWLRCGECFVTGGEPREHYQVLTHITQNTNKPCGGKNA